MSKRVNKSIRKFVLRNINYCKSPSGRVSWKKLLNLVENEFPNEDLTFERVRSIYRNSSDLELARAERGGYGEPSKETVVPKIEEQEDEIGEIRRSRDNMEATMTTNKNPANLSEDDIVDLFQIDKKKWAWKGLSTKAWNSTVRVDKGKSEVVRNYSVKANFKLRSNDVFLDKDVMQEIFDEAQKQYEETFGKTKRRVSLGKENGNTLVMGVFDVHIGKLAWWKETGENYDLKIASKRFLNVVKNIVDKAVLIGGVDNIIFPIGNDFFQFDNDKPTTTRDTPVDTDIRWQKLFQRGVVLLRNAIDYCSQFANVDVIWVPGNHDFKASFYAFESLRGWYNKDDRVTIDEDIKTRTYRLVGKNLLGFTHGDKEKAKRLHGLMSTSVPEMWGKSLYREWIVGHFHKGMLSEDMGVSVRVLGSITGTDAWHYQKGFIGSLRAAQGLIFNENKIGPSLILYEAIDITKEPEQT